MLPDSKGLESLNRIHQRVPEMPIVVLTATDDLSLALQALRQGAQDYLMKSELQLSPHALSRAIRYALQRQKAEADLLSAQRQTSQLLSSIPSILIGVNAAGAISHWNAVAEDTFGVTASSALGQPLARCPIGWEAPRLLRCVEDCRRTNQVAALDDVAFRRSDGQEGFLGITMIPMREAGTDGIGVLLFGADVTARKRVETERTRLAEQLLQAQKMETIGRFAGGIAHDFNNFLQVILGFAWLIRSRHRDDKQLMSDFQEIVHAAESASSMVRQLLAFSRRQPLKPQVFDISGVVQRMQRLLQQFVGERIRIELQLADEPLQVKLDPTGLEQILMNLCSNARDSMPQGGTLTIRTHSQTLDAAAAGSYSHAAPGAYVRLSVTDTGTGMEPAMAEHIFEPFFTTKQLSRGTGLGLAVVYGLVQQHDGFIDIDTALGQGTTFHLSFPRQEGSRPPATAGGGAVQGAEAILLIEQDARQRTLDEEVLRDSGYRLIASTDGTGPLEPLLQQCRNADVIILDAALPGVQAADVVSRIRQACPRMKVLLVSGFVDDGLRAVESKTSGVLVLQRPYVPAYLLDQLRLLLDQPSAAGVVPAAPVAQAADRRVLIVDDDPAVRQLCQRILQAVYQVTAAASGAEALDALRQQTFDLLLTDLKMPQMDGYTLIDEVKKLHPSLPIVAMTGFLTGEMEQRWKAGRPVADVLRKPFTPPEVLTMVERVLSERAL